mgnify:CR=1 FL=1
MTLLATFKHISSKNADYGAAEAYLTFEHDEFTMKPTLDENGRLIPREDYRISSPNCGGEDFAVACIQIVSNVHPDMVIKDVRKHLARCGISSKHAMQAIGTLSGGEQAKVKMCLLTLTPCNFLIMDEPTNHLDVQAKDALKSALMDFNGTVLLVSHEEAFYRDWTQRIINIEKR